jgi:hypothetical protein
MAYMDVTDTYRSVVFAAIGTLLSLISTSVKAAGLSRGSAAKGICLNMSPPRAGIT